MFNILAWKMTDIFLSIGESINQLIIAAPQFSVTLFILQEVHQCACIHSNQQILHSICTL